MKEKLPSLREAIILTVLQKKEVYGLEIERRYAVLSGEAMPHDSLYTTLNRMEDRGYIKSSRSKTTNPKGGNYRKYFKLTTTGKKSLNEFERIVKSILENKVNK